MSADHTPDRALIEWEDGALIVDHNGAFVTIADISDTFALSLRPADALALAMAIRSIKPPGKEPFEELFHIETYAGYLSAMRMYGAAEFRLTVSPFQLRLPPAIHSLLPGALERAAAGIAKSKEPVATRRH